MDAVDELSKYTHRHHHAGGLYLIKLDIQSYTDEVYVGEDSKIWSIIEELFMSEGIQPSAYMMKMIRFIIRPEYYNHDDHLMMNLYGIPTGSAITAILYNYYIIILLTSHLNRYREKSISVRNIIIMMQKLIN